MEPDRRYESHDLRGFVPDISSDHLREIMQELRIHRQVERAGSSGGWWRHRSASPHVPQPMAREIQAVQAVKPEDLLDHDAFAEFFK
jgi:hypothetical protein